MSIAITDDHRALAETASDLLRSRDALGASRKLLEAPAEDLPSWWHELAELGWLGLHLPEEHGGSGYTLEELVVVVESMRSDADMRALFRDEVKPRLAKYAEIGAYNQEL